MHSSPLRIALIGAGGIAGAHTKAIQSLPDDVDCVAVCDPNTVNRDKKIADLGGTPRPFDSWTDLLNTSPESVDAFIICLPHHLHAPAIRDAAAAGKHVLCEKPMCTNLEEARAITEAVKASGITYMSAHCQLFLPSFQKACELVREGRIGRVRWIRSQDCFRMKKWKTKSEGNWRADAATQGGGELIDTGYHPTYRLLEIAGSKPAAIRGTMGRFHLDLDAEDTASVQVRFENGVIGEILTSWAFANPYGSHEIHVIGDEGQLFGSGADLYYLPLDCEQPAKIKTVSSGNAWLGSFTGQLEAFARCARTGERPPHTEEEGLAVLEIILGAARDAEGWQNVNA